MADFSSIGGNHEVLEADLGRLAEEVRMARERPEFKDQGDKEIIKQSLERMMPNLSAQNRTSGGQPGDDSSGILPPYAKDVSPETKLEIEYLLDLALHKGLDEANKAAAKSSPFVLDAFHDTLVLKFYSEMVRRGILK